MGVSGDPKYSNESFANNSKGKSDFYETFDSGAGVMIPEGMEKDFAHNDSGPNLSSTDYDLAVPQVPSKK